MLFWIILFIVSYVLKSPIIGDVSNMNHNLNKLYSALLVMSIMFSVDSFIYDSKNSMMYILASIVLIFLMKDQIFVTDDQYLSSLIELQQQSIDISNKIKDKTGNQLVKNIALKITETYPVAINDAKILIQAYKPVLNFT
jgi:hypothetical protein